MQPEAIDLQEGFCLKEASKSCGRWHLSVVGPAALLLSHTALEIAKVFAKATTE